MVILGVIFLLNLNSGKIHFQRLTSKFILKEYNAHKSENSFTHPYAVPVLTTFTISLVRSYIQ